MNSPKDEIDKTIGEVVTNYYNNYEQFDSDIERYSNAWNKYNDNFFEALSKYLNISWPKEHDIVYATVGIIPVCPRYLDTFYFSVHVDINNEALVETCAHELCHFLWFEKWRELYPESNKDDYEFPNTVWKYSEIVVEPILNSKEISKVFDGKNTRYCYESFYDIYDGEELFMTKLVNIYDEDISIEEKISKGYEYVKSIRKNNRKKAPK